MIPIRLSEYNCTCELCLNDTICIILNDNTYLCRECAIDVSIEMLHEQIDIFSSIIRKSIRLLRNGVLSTKHIPDKKFTNEGRGVVGELLCELYESLEDIGDISPRCFVCGCIEEECDCLG